MVASLAGAQGSAAGIGQGVGGYAGGGGGLGGGGGGRFGDSTGVQAHPEDDGGEDGKLYESRTAILTPGDRVEYKLKVEEGETLFAGAASEAFDPALSIENATGKVLAKNDDREDGDQSPFLAFRFPESGTYTLKVLSYKQAAGGKFTLKLRTFTASNASIGRSIHDFSEAHDLSHRVDVRISAKKGIVYDLRSAPAGPNGTPSFVRLIGPTGVERSDIDRVVTPDGGPVFEAMADGDYYAEYRVYGPTRFSTVLTEVPVTRTKVDAEATVELAPGALALVKFPVDAKQFVRSTLLGEAFTHSMSAPIGPGVSDGSDYRSNDPAFGYAPPWTYFLLDRDSNRDVVRIYRAAGDATFAIRSTATKVERVILRNTTALSTWKAGETISDRLDVGEIRLYRLDSASSELMRVAAESPTFRPRLDIFRLDGALANTLPYRTKHTAADDLYFPKADTFLVRLSCEGYGGSGEYRLRRDTPEPSSYVLGLTGKIAFDGTNFGLYAVTLEAGKRYQLRTDGTVPGLRTDLLDADGVFLRSQAVFLDQVRVEYFVPTRSGIHRLWLRGASGAVRFRLEFYPTPTLGD